MSSSTFAPNALQLASTSRLDLLRLCKVEPLERSVNERPQLLGSREGD